MVSKTVEHDLETEQQQSINIHTTFKFPQLSPKSPLQLFPPIHLKFMLCNCQFQNILPHSSVPSTTFLCLSEHLLLLKALPNCPTSYPHILDLSISTSLNLDQRTLARPPHRACRAPPTELHQDADNIEPSHHWTCLAGQLSKCSNC